MQYFLKFKVCLLIIAHSSIGKSNDAFQVQSNDTKGKYIQFNSVHNEQLKNADFPAWYEALKECTLIALGGDLKLRKHLQKAQFYGYVKPNRSFGDIVVESKGKYSKISEEIYGFHQTNDNEEDNSFDSQNIKALWKVEKIRHHMKQSGGYRYDLRFTIIPIDKILKKKERNLRDLRKRVFILRDIDYPEYFSSHLSLKQLKMRLDNFLIPHTPMIFNRASSLNFGEYQKGPKPFSMMKHHHHQNFNRFPIRFPDSQEVLPSPKNVKHMTSEALHETHEMYPLDHRGADFKRLYKELNLGNSYYQPAAITIPMIAVPFYHFPYAFPMQFQVPNVASQRSQSTFSKNPAQIKATENQGVNSMRVQNFSPPDPKINQNDYFSNKHETKVPIKYSPKLNEYMDQSNEFRPIIPAQLYPSRSSLVTKIPTTLAHTTTTKKSKTQNNIEARKMPKIILTSTPESTTELSVKSFDTDSTHSSLIEKTERPALKWHPKKTKTKIFSSLTTQSQTVVETTPKMRNINSSARSLPFRGRNRFLLKEKFFRNLTTTTEKSTSTISSEWKAITSTILPNLDTIKLISSYETTASENENTTLKPQNIIELISANVEEVTKNSSSNFNIYKATEIDDSYSNVEPAGERSIPNYLHKVED